MGPEFCRLVEKIKPGEQSVYKVSQKGSSISLAIRVTEFKMKNEHFKLISVQNIHRELEERELEAWQKLIRVLTHETDMPTASAGPSAVTFNEKIYVSGGTPYIATDCC